MTDPAETGARLRAELDAAAARLEAVNRARRPRNRPAPNGTVIAGPPAEGAGWFTRYARAAADHSAAHAAHRAWSARNAPPRGPAHDAALTRMLNTTARRTGDQTGAAIAAVLDDTGFAWRDSDTRRRMIARHVRRLWDDRPAGLAAFTAAVTAAVLDEAGYPYDPGQVTAAATRHLAQAGQDASPRSRT